MDDVRDRTDDNGEYAPLPGETIAGTGPGIPDDSLAPGETELPTPPGDREAADIARALGTKPPKNE